MSDEDECNWMRFVRPADQFGEQVINIKFFKGRLWLVAKCGDFTKFVFITEFNPEPRRRSTIFYFDSNYKP